MQKLYGWGMPGEDAQGLINLIDERLQTSRLDQTQHDFLVRLCSMLEDDLTKTVSGEQNQDTRYFSAG
jgi:hypothetical protein